MDVKRLILLDCLCNSNIFMVVCTKTWDLLDNRSIFPFIPSRFCLDYGYNLLKVSVD